MSSIHHYDLQPIEDDYRKLTAQGDTAAETRMKNTIEALRYDLRMGFEIHMEYRDGMEKPMVMRILRNEKDLDRWVAQRFIRLEEF
jgi:hypothetical protein